MPTIIIQPSLKDAGLETARPNTNTGTDQVIWMGLYYPPSRYRLIIQFDLSALPSDIWITSAILRLYIVETTDANVSGIFTPYRVTEPWNELTVTWNNQPPFDPSVFGGQTAILGPGWYEWDITSLVRAWYMGIYPNYGMLLKTDETIPFETKLLYSREAVATPMLRPMLEISYQTVVSIAVAQRSFIETSISINTSDEWLYASAFDVSQQRLVTVFVRNTGTKDALVKLQISPDNYGYVDDSAAMLIPSGITDAVVPVRFGRYLRVAYRSANINQSTSLTIWCQGQL